MASPVRVLSDRDVKITITPDPNSGRPPTVFPPTFHVSKSKKEEVWWVCTDPNALFTVKFDNDISPFNYPDFDNENQCSGLARRDVKPGTGKRYKYSVSVNNGPALDPDGQVDN